MNKQHDSLMQNLYDEIINYKTITFDMFNKIIDFVLLNNTMHIMEITSSYDVDPQIKKYIIEFSNFDKIQITVISKTNVVIKIQYCKYANNFYAYYSQKYVKNIISKTDIGWIYYNYNDIAKENMFKSYFDRHVLFKKMIIQLQDQKMNKFGEKHMQIYRIINKYPKNRSQKSRSMQYKYLR